MLSLAQIEEVEDVAGGKDGIYISKQVVVLKIRHVAVSLLKSVKNPIDFLVTHLG